MKFVVVKEKKVCQLLKHRRIQMDLVKLLKIESRLKRVYPMEENRLVFEYIHPDQFLYLEINQKLKKTNECNLQTYCNGIKSGHHNLCTTVDVRTQVICAQSKGKQKEIIVRVILFVF
jgi:hypothetical protein